ARRAENRGPGFGRGSGTARPVHSPGFRRGQLDRPHFGPKRVRRPDRFNLWRRQDFDQPATSPLEGGKVWEHWCTLRDLRPSNRVGLSALTAYVSLAAALGDRFCAAVARGRRDYGHPRQLCALVHAGFVAKDVASWDVTPTVISAALEPGFLEADPEHA